MVDEAKAELAEVARLSLSLSLSSFQRPLFPYEDPEVRQRLEDGLRRAGVPE
jgi:hypothetical protein